MKKVFYTQSGRYYAIEVETEEVTRSALDTATLIMLRNIGDLDFSERVGFDADTARKIAKHLTFLADCIDHMEEEDEEHGYNAS